MPDHRTRAGVAVLRGFGLHHHANPVDRQGQGGRIHILNFYVRRALRLFPALLVLVALGVIFDMDGFRGLAKWPLLQASNICFAMSHTVKPWVTGHLWSLNVLEQFHLLRPIVILLPPLRRIYVLVLAIIATMIFLRVNATTVGIDGWRSFFPSTPTRSPWARLPVC